MAPSFQWWAKESHRGTPVVVKMENPNWSMVELQSPEDEDFLPNNKGRGKNAKQLTWVLLLKAHKAAGCLTSIASATFGLGAAIRRRVASGRTDSDTNNEIEIENNVTENPTVKSRFYSCIKLFLWLSLVLLGFEVAAYFNGWHFGSPHLDLHRLLPTEFGFQTMFDYMYSSWVLVRVEYLAPPLQFLANVCIILFLIQSADRLLLCLGCFYIKWKKIKPIPNTSIQDIDIESNDAHAETYFPMVLVQIPMCNEKEVYQQSIAAVCNLDWPKSNILIQVLDDSDDPTTQILIKEEVYKWQHEGANIIYRHRVIRDGYKAGNLKSAMNCSYVKDYEFVAIFDADFQPTPEFLKKTVPHFKDNEELALVQARWSFVNKDENLLTRLQNINLSFHFEVEQQVNGIFLNFFGFNGTAGVWRIKALEESGGWLERTTVEDMDIAVRAHLHGWKFIFLNDVECQCELPESYEAYRKQQHRWHSGPMQLFRLCLPDIIRAKISVGKKANLIFLFFLLRKLVLPFYSFTLFCIILPMTMFVPEAELPAWVVCYIPATMSFLNILPAPKSFPFIVPYLLFENTMSVTKFNAMISGLFQLGSAYEWVVTKKSGRSSEGDLFSLVEKDPKQQQRGNSLPNLDPKIKYGGVKAMPFIVGNETFEKLGTIGSAANLSIYLTTVFNMKRVAAATLVNIFNGTTNLVPILGAFLSDSYYGRYKTLGFASISSFMGLFMLALTAAITKLHPPHCKDGEQCIEPTAMQLAFLISGFGFLIVGAGGIRPCNLAFGADQFNPETESGKKLLSSFFNWYYFTFTFAMMVSLTVIVYVQTNISWTIGLGIPAGLMFLSVAVFFWGTKIYVIVKPEGSPLTGVLQVFVAATKKRRLQLPEKPQLSLFNYFPADSINSKLPYTDQFRFLDKAAIITPEDAINPDGSAANRWRLCRIQQVEEVKCLMRVLPIWVATIIFYTATVEQETYAVYQAAQSDRRFGRMNFKIPEASYVVIIYLTLTISIPIYDRLIVPIARKITAKEGGITLLQRMGVGIFLAPLTMFVSALVEMRRRNIALSQPTMGTAKDGGAISSMSAFWLVPQLCLAGLSQAFGCIGQVEFYYKQFPENMRSIAGSFFFCSMGLANYLNGFLVSLIHRLTKNSSSGNWLPQDLNNGRLDYFYFVVAGLGVVNFVYFLLCASWYRYKGIDGGTIELANEPKEREKHMV